MDASTETPEDQAASPLGMDEDMAASPQAMFKSLRDSSPVMAIEGTGVVLSRKVDIDEALRHPELFTSNMTAVDLKNARPLIPLQIDPPEHKKFRKLLDPIFAPRLMTAMEDEVAILVNDLIDRFIDRGEVDFAAEFSIPYPSQVFLTLLGLPLDELDRFLAMKDGIIRPGHVTGKGDGSHAADAHQQQTADSIYEYFNRVLDEREVEPRDDLVSRFLSAEVDEHRLSREDILDICFLFLIAGLDTVTDSLTLFFAYLGQHPDHRRQIVDDPSVIPAAVEELLRWETPVAGTARAATEDGVVAGCPISAGSLVFVSIGAANVDPAVFGEPFEVRFDRTENRHLGFGGGVHRCLGSHLARRELRVALREWHRRIPEYELKPGITLNYPPGLRSVDNLELVWATS